MEADQLKELLLQSLEHERRGVIVYATALDCVQNEDLKEEWTAYHEQTQTHVQRLEEICDEMGLDAEEETTGREIVRSLGESLVSAMKLSFAAGDRAAAQLVACECVVLAETKDQLDWELLAEAAKQLTGSGAQALKAAVKEIEEEEDEHLYHTKGWCRELWLKSLGLRAVLPPPEERKHVYTTIGAARAEQERSRMR
jgi:rubrerythrin